MGLQLRHNTIECPLTPLCDRVQRIVNLRTAARVKDLQVNVQGQDVILRGIAPTYYVKQLATHAALDEIEHYTLTNDIDVA
ncbi:MAG: hypothetical protein KDA93_26185 [Planctomycetaceae bacterium]|nr:hypothetical protein [Planctomycetaceae bacterium]